MNQSPLAFEIVMESDFSKENSSSYRRNASCGGFFSESFENFPKDIALKKNILYFRKYCIRLKMKALRASRKIRHQEKTFQAKDFREICCLILQKKAFKLF